MQSFTFQKPELSQQINGVFCVFLKISFHLFPHLLPHLLYPYLLFHDLMLPCVSSLNLGHQLSLVHSAQWEEPWETMEDNLIIPSSGCRPLLFTRKHNGSHFPVGIGGESVAYILDKIFKSRIQPQAEGWSEDPRGSVPTRERECDQVSE